MLSLIVAVPHRSWRCVGPERIQRFHFLKTRHSCFTPTEVIIYLWIIRYDLSINIIIRNLLSLYIFSNGKQAFRVSTGPISWNADNFKRLIQKLESYFYCEKTFRIMDAEEASKGIVSNLLVCLGGLNIIKYNNNSL